MICQQCNALLRNWPVLFWNETQLEQFRYFSRLQGKYQFSHADENKREQVSNHTVLLFLDLTLLPSAQFESKHQSVFELLRRNFHKYLTDYQPELCETYFSVKFGYSEKATKFEKIFHLKFCGLLRISQLQVTFSYIL